MAIVEESRGVPLAMQDMLRVPRERYFDRGFFELEKQRLWPRVWQMACRLEEIPDPGDFVEYEICDQSVLVIRQSDMSIKALHNACRHRATQLCRGSGRLGGGQIVCPFHGWRWNLDGTNSFVYGREGFDEYCLRPDDINLQECLVDTWGGSVWINMDREAGPLSDWLGETATLLDDVGVGNIRVWWWKETILKANWKVAQEAFHEGIHVPSTHPQLKRNPSEGPTAQSDYFAFANGHGRFGRGRALEGGIGRGLPPDDFIARLRMTWEGQDAMILERDLRVFEGIRRKVGPDDNFGVKALEAIYEYAAGAGIPMPPMRENIKIWGGVIFMFPNYFMLPLYGNSLAYRFRPYEDDPECTRFDVWSLTTYPEGLEPQGRAALQGRYASDDQDPAGFGLIPRQDMSNTERQQRGLHSSSYQAHRLATEWEKLISNMHRELDRYLA